MGEDVPSKKKKKTDITCASVYNKKTKSHNSNNNKFDKRKMDMFTTRNYEWKTVGLIKIPNFFVGAKISHKLWNCNPQIAGFSIELVSLNVVFFN